MRPPAPHKLVCPKCGYSKIARAKSDALSLADIMEVFCPKCETRMKRRKLTFFDELMDGWRFWGRG